VQRHLRRIALAAQEVKRVRLSPGGEAELHEVAAEEMVAPGYPERVVVPGLQIADEFAAAHQHEVSLGKRDGRPTVQGIGISSGVRLERQRGLGMRLARYLVFRLRLSLVRPRLRHHRQQPRAPVDVGRADIVVEDNVHQRDGQVGVVLVGKDHDPEMA